MRSCFAVGSYTKGSVTRNLVEHWNGANWGLQPNFTPAGATTTSLNGVACPTVKSCFAVGNPSAAKKLKDLPIWVFHGDEDRAVPVSRSRDMVKALQKAGAKNVKYTEYPGVGHDSWTKTYDNPELYKWLLSQKRGGKKKDS